jgi:signal transduction histidine kinase
MFSKMQALSPHLHQRMLPLSLVILFLISVVLPKLYEQTLSSQLEAQSSVWAFKVSRQLSQFARERGKLWSYDERGVFLILMPLIEQNMDIHLEIKLPNQKERSLHYGNRSSEIAHIQIREKLPQFPQVTLDLSVPTTEITQQISFLRYLAILFGLLISGMIYWIPMRAIQKADLENQTLWQQVIQSNHELEDRVMTRTADLEKLSERLLNIQEEERARISRDLHDELGQTLTGLRLYLTTIKQQMSQADLPLSHSSKIDQVIQLALQGIDFAVDQVRNIAYQMRPPELDSLGLNDAILALLRQKSKQYGWQFHFDHQLVDNLSLSQSEVCFRLIQEALTNIARHAQALEIWVKLFEVQTENDHNQQTQIILEVWDNGIGLKDDFKKGVGLRGAQARIKHIQGQIELKRINSITVFSAKFPKSNQ